MATGDYAAAHAAVVRFLTQRLDEGTVRFNTSDIDAALSPLGLQGIGPAVLYSLTQQGVIQESSDGDALSRLWSYGGDATNTTTTPDPNPRRGGHALHYVIASPALLADEARRGETQPPPLATPTEAEGATPALSERKYIILQTLLELSATSADTRRTTAEIAMKAEGKAADPAQFKRDIAELKAAGFIDTRTGRDGGAWLTTKGRNLAERLVE